MLGPVERYLLTKLRDLKLPPESVVTSSMERIDTKKEVAKNINSKAMVKNKFESGDFKVIERYNMY